MLVIPGTTQKISKHKKLLCFVRKYFMYTCVFYSSVVPHKLRAFSSPLPHLENPFVDPILSNINPVDAFL
jgi:hypothetical protein